LLRKSCYDKYIRLLQLTFLFNILNSVLQATKDAIRKINSIVDAEGVQLVVILIPSNYQVDARLYGAITRAQNLPITDGELDKLERLLRKFLADEGVQFIDLLPLFREVLNDDCQLSC